MEKQFKYRINELLEKMPLAGYRMALAYLPVELDVSKKTFDNYRAIEIGDKQDIPHSIVDKMEIFFGIPSGALQNFTSEIRPMADVAADKKTLTKKYGLTKA